MGIWKSTTGQTAAQKWRSMPKKSKLNMLSKNNFSAKYADYSYTDLTTRLKQEVKQYRFRNTKKEKAKFEIIYNSGNPYNVRVPGSFESKSAAQKKVKSLKAGKYGSAIKWTKIQRYSGPGKTLKGGRSGL